MQRDISAVSVSDRETLDEIRRTYERIRVVLDPHTAVGVSAARAASECGSSAASYIVAATAHPGKFPEVVKLALGTTPPLPEKLREALRRPKQSIRIAADYGEVKRLLLT